MPLFRRKSGKDQVPEGLESYYDQPSGWRLWARRIVGIVAVVLLVFLLLWAVMWVYRSVTDDGVDTGNTNVSEDSGTSEDEAATGTDGETTDEGTDNGSSQDNAQSEEDAGNQTGSANGSESEDTTEEQMPNTGDAPLPATGG